MRASPLKPSTGVQAFLQTVAFALRTRVEAGSHSAPAPWPGARCLCPRQRPPPPSRNRLRRNLRSGGIRRAAAARAALPKSPDPALAGPCRSSLRSVVDFEHCEPELEQDYKKQDYKTVPWSTLSTVNLN